MEQEKIQRYYLLFGITYDEKHVNKNYLETLIERKNEILYYCGVRKTLESKYRITNDEILYMAIPDMISEIYFDILSTYELSENLDLSKFTKLEKIKFWNSDILLFETLLKLLCRLNNPYKISYLVNDCDDISNICLINTYLLNNLIELILQEVHIVTDHIIAISYHTQLTKLIIAHTSITACETNTLMYLTTLVNLNELELFESYDMLAWLDFLSKFNNNTISTLSINRCALYKEINRKIDRIPLLSLTKLIDLYIGYSYKVIPIIDISDISSLERVTIESSGCTIEYLMSLRNLSNIEVLTIRVDKIMSGSGINMMIKNNTMYNLRALSLSTRSCDSYIDDEELVELGKCKYLEGLYLDLDYSSLDFDYLSDCRLYLRCLSKLTTLRRLHIDNSICSEELSIIGTLTNLQRLNISIIDNSIMINNTIRIFDFMNLFTINKFNKITSLTIKLDFACILINTHCTSPTIHPYVESIVEGININTWVAMNKWNKKIKKLTLQQLCIKVIENYCK